jgi:hypothetical protein
MQIRLSKPFTAEVYVHRHHPVNAEDQRMSLLCSGTLPLTRNPKGQPVRSE